MDPVQQQTLLADLSSDLHDRIADYLAKTSRALLAVALTAPSRSWAAVHGKDKPSAASRTLIESTKPDLPYETLLDDLVRETCSSRHEESHRREPYRSSGGTREGVSEQIKRYYRSSEWDTLDFVDLEKSLASKLTDDDLRAILLCIDAARNVRVLNLTNCVKIMGNGLKPLKHSTNLAECDFSLVHHFVIPDGVVKSGQLQANISDGVIMGVLTNILSKEGNALRRVIMSIRKRNSVQCGPSYGLIHHGIFKGAYYHSLSYNFYFGFESAIDFVAAVNASSGYRALPSEWCIRCHSLNVGCCEKCEMVGCTGPCLSGKVASCVRCGLTGCTYNRNCTGSVSECRSACGYYCCDCLVQSCRDNDNDCQDCKSDAFEILLERMQALTVQNEALTLQNEALQEQLGRPSE